eukprot:COSAG05_NODE_691_length_7896_cov_83.318549_5_plen_44_part_00
MTHRLLGPSTKRYRALHYLRTTAVLFVGEKMRASAVQPVKWVR